MVSIVRVDRAVVASTGGTFTYTNWTADTGLHRMYFAYGFYITDDFAGGVNFTHLGYTAEMTDLGDVAGELSPGGTFLKLTGRFRTSVPSSNITITVPSDPNLQSDVVFLVMVLETDAAIDDVDSPYDGSFFVRPSWFGGNFTAGSDYNSTGSLGSGGMPQLFSSDPDVTGPANDWQQTFFMPHAAVGVEAFEDTYAPIDTSSPASGTAYGDFYYEAAATELGGANLQLGFLAQEVSSVWNYPASAFVDQAMTDALKTDAANVHGYDVFLTGISEPAPATISPDSISAEVNYSRVRARSRALPYYLDTGLLRGRD